MAPGALRHFLDLDHQLERDEHRVLPAREPPFSDLAGMGHQADVHFGPQGAVGAGFNDTTSDEDFGDEGFDRAPVIEDGADQAADAAADLAPSDVSLGA